MMDVFAVHSPERIADNEHRDVIIDGAGQQLVSTLFDHFAIG